MAAPSDPDHEISDIARRCYGVITYRELRTAGLGRQAIAYRVGRRRLVELYPGVYAVGHPALAREGRWLAAVRAGGPSAVLSHGDAGALWNLLPSRGSVIHVTTPSRAGRVPDRRRVRLHRVGTLTEDEVTAFARIPVTTPARTLLDLARSLRPRAIEDLVEHMDRLQLFDLLAVRRCLAAHPRQPGAPALRATLDRLLTAPAADTRSPLEVAMLQLCDDYNLPTPLANTVVAGFLVDFHWPGTDLIARPTASRSTAPAPPSTPTASATSS